VGVCIIEPAFGEKHLCESVMDRKQLIVPVERRCNAEGHIEVSNGLLHLTLGVIYFTKGTVTLAD
jgi:hypothetical protein